VRIIFSAIAVTSLAIMGNVPWAYGQREPSQNLLMQSLPNDFPPPSTQSSSSASFAAAPMPAPLPDAPYPQKPTSTAEPWGSPQDIDFPQTVQQKFLSYAVGTFGPRALVIPMFPAAYQMAWPPSHYPREWRDGAGAVGRNYGDQLAEVSVRNTARFATAVILHEDMRYRPSSLTNPIGRTLHALTYTFVNQSDNGNRELAWDNFVGAAAGGYIGRLYLPPGFNNISHADTRMAFQFGFLTIGNVSDEFAPELYRFSQKIHFKLLREIPEWWNGGGDSQ
jgi:hypothetical protein